MSEEMERNLERLDPRAEARLWQPPRLVSHLRNGAFGRNVLVQAATVVSIPLAPWSHEVWAHELLTSRSWAGHSTSLSLSFLISRRGTGQACRE